jgi:hypothetical protein
MVNVRLDQDWTDEDGVSHVAGATVDVDPGTLARLESTGIVASTEGLDELDVEPLTIGPGLTGDGTIGPGEPPPDPDGTTIGPGTPDEDDDDSDGSIDLGRGIVAEPVARRTIGPGSGPGRDV